MEKEMEETRKALIELRDEIIIPLGADEVDDVQEILNNVIFDNDRYKEAINFAIAGMGIKWP